MNTKERKSSIELLKIIAMFLICMSHVVGPILAPANATFSLNINSILCTFAKNAGWLGDYIFIACSAYFMVDCKKIKIRKILLYYLDVVFLFLSYLGIFLLFNVSVSSELITKTLTTKIFTSYWFIHAYLQYLVLVPLINLLIKVLPRKVHQILCYMSLVVGAVLLVLQQTVFSSSLLRILIFFFMTLIMAYGKKYGTFLFFKENNRKVLKIALIISLAYWFFKVIIINVIGVYGNIFIECSTDICHINEPNYYIISIVLFLLFKDMNFKQSKFINLISSLSLIFYVGHHNKYTSILTTDYLLNVVNSASPIFTFPIFLLASIIRFVYGILIAFIFHISIHKGLVFLTNIGSKHIIKNKEKTLSVEQNSIEDKSLNEKADDNEQNLNKEIINTDTKDST